MYAVLDMRRSNVLYSNVAMELDLASIKSGDGDIIHDKRGEKPRDCLSSGGTFHATWRTACP